MTPSALADTWKDWVEGRNPQAREDLILHYLPWVKRKAKYMKNKGTPTDEEDLASAGVIGLIDAINRFDPDMGVPFEGFALSRVNGAMTDSQRRNDWAPRLIRSRDRILKNTDHELSQKLKRHPTDEELSKRLGLTTQELNSWRASVEHAAINQLDVQIEAGYEPISERGGPHDEMDTKVTHRLVREAVDLYLTPQQWVVVDRYYNHEWTFKEIGEYLGLTESRASQIHTMAVERLRTALIDRGVA